MDRRLVVAGVLAGLAVGLVYGLDAGWPARRPGDWAEKVTASRLTAEAFGVIRAAKAARGIHLPAEDVNRTGVIGPAVSPLVSSVGHLGAKRTAANPSFAAVLVELFHEAGARRGDAVALAFSGSFPSLNIATLAAAHVLGLRPVLISSLGASNYGAADPEMTWLDMETVLRDRGLWASRSFRAGLGGIPQVPQVFDRDPRELALAALARNGVPLIEEGAIEAAVAARLAAYAEAAGGAPIRVFVNVGGAAVNLGEGPVAARMPGGLHLLSALDVHRGRGVVSRMAERGIPVIHLLSVERLVRRYGLPVDPSPLPPIGEGVVFERGPLHRPRGRSRQNGRIGSGEAGRHQPTGMNGVE